MPGESARGVRCGASQGGGASSYRVVSGRSDNAARCCSWRRAPAGSCGTALRGGFKVAPSAAGGAPGVWCVQPQGGGSASGVPPMPKAGGGLLGRFDNAGGTPPRCAGGPTREAGESVRAWGRPRTKSRGCVASWGHFPDGVRGRDLEDTHGGLSGSWGVAGIHSNGRALGVSRRRGWGRARFTDCPADQLPLTVGELGRQGRRQQCSGKVGGA